MELNYSKDIQVGDKVIILRPSHVAGKIGVIHAKEVLTDENVSRRWIIQIDSENIMLSLNRREFELLNE